MCGSEGDMLMLEAERVRRVGVLHGRMDSKESTTFCKT